MPRRPPILALCLERQAHGLPGRRRAFDRECGLEIDPRLPRRRASETILQTRDIQTCGALAGFAAAQPTLRAHPARAIFLSALNTSSRHQRASSLPVANQTPPACFMCRIIVRSALPRPGRPEM